MIVAIVDYGSGNLHSAQKAFERAARDFEIPAHIRVSQDADFIARADYVVLPGVGAFADCRAGLDAVDGVVAIAPDNPELKIPHMGWNTLERQNHAIFNGIASGLHAYFVHSFHMKVQDERERLATTDYGGPVTAMVGRDNMLGAQFHPEKSQRLGLNLIGNFLRWRP